MAGRDGNGGETAPPDVADAQAVDSQKEDPWTALLAARPGDWTRTWQQAAGQIGQGGEEDGSRAAAGQAAFAHALAQNPMVASIDRMWNANPLSGVVPIDWAGIAGALRTVWLRSLSDPGRTLAGVARFNAAAMGAAADVWRDAVSGWWGLAPEPAGRTAPPDKRFDAPEWRDPAFRMLKELYLLASDALLDPQVLAGLDETERHRVAFHLRQFVNAASPSVMLFSNPVALKRAVRTGGASLAAGMGNLARDLRAGRLSMADATAFAPGRNLARTPGRVVLRNALIELIQYAPATDAVHAVPLLVLPPWINKFYILDMRPENSMVGHLVAAGYTVFLVSWKNPDASMEATGIADYMRLGPLAAHDVIRDITGCERPNVMGYCIGGTLLAITLAWLAAGGERRFGAATFMVSLQDFEHVGDSRVFTDDAAIDLIERQMMERGYLDSREMYNMFNLLRSNELIWSNVVNNYLLGQDPPAFDLLYWNSDGTRMARAAHEWYLRNTYRENNLIKPGRIELEGRRLDLGRVDLDVYAVGAEKDHIVPWDGAWRVARLLDGSVRYVLASSGHIAGIINPPGRQGSGGKGSYQAADVDPATDTAARWREAAPRRDGSWWTDWFGWLAARSGERVPPPGLGSAAHPPLDAAPGLFVLER